ncbi:protein of unknown function [Hyphomicrobium sp. 1Nfss2.1]
MADGFSRNTEIARRPRQSYGSRAASVRPSAMPSALIVRQKVWKTLFCINVFASQPIANGQSEAAAKVWIRRRAGSVTMSEDIQAQGGTTHAAEIVRPGPCQRGGRRHRDQRQPDGDTLRPRTQCARGSRRARGA